MNYPSCKNNVFANWENNNS